jgi:hypothetical protein
LVVITGVAGVGFTVTEVVAGAEGQLFTAAIKVYVPEALVGAFTTMGCCWEAVKEAGPFQE